MISSTSTTSLKLSPSGKQYLFFQSDGKSDHSAQCEKSKALTKFIDLIIDIEYFEQKYVNIIYLLHSDQLKQHMVNIGIDKSLSNSAMYEHIYLGNINKLYTSTGKYDN